MLQNLADDLGVGYEADDHHLAAALRADQRINLPDLFDVPRSKCPWGAFPPLRRWDVLRPIFGYVDDFHCSRHVRLVGGGSRLFALLALAPAAVRVPAVIAHQLKGFFREVMGDGGNEF